MLFAKPEGGFKIEKSGIVQFRERGVALSKQRLDEYNLIVENLKVEGHNIGDLRYSDDPSFRVLEMNTDNYIWVIEYAVSGDVLEILYMRYREK